jgi:ubiquinone/menaquinone biosynthesis C-methylase UbiE
MSRQPDWKLPSGTSQSVWDYASDSEIARAYDSKLADTPLLEFDLKFAGRFFGTNGSLVDLGCGTGRLLIPFARRGFSVLGVDLSQEMLRVAAGKSQAAAVSVPLIRASLVELDCLRDESFDWAACLFSTLGMISGRPNRLQALKHVRRILKARGRFCCTCTISGFICEHEPAGAGCCWTGGKLSPVIRQRATSNRRRAWRCIISLDARSGRTCRRPGSRF